MSSTIPESAEVVSLYYRVSHKTAIWWIWLRKMVDWGLLWG
jgi:hypothetical protein